MLPIQVSGLPKFWVRTIANQPLFYILCLQFSLFDEMSNHEQPKERYVFCHYPNRCPNGAK